MALTDNLISYWKLDEASGNALDAHGSNTLTDNNTVGSATGKLNNARDFELSNDEYLSIADNADLSVGDEDFTSTCWINAENLDARRGILGKVSAAGVTEYWFDFDLLRFRFAVGNGTTVGTVEADNLGDPSLATWYFLVGWHDAAANTVNIQVNNGTVDSQAFADGAADLTGGFAIGRLGAFGLPWDGLIDEVGFWKRVLTSQERTDLYNGGAGLAYADFAPAVSVPPFFAYRRPTRFFSPCR